ncbi:hypothetical protein [Methanobacterium sp. ACI-7]|uniref:hypothetical protein n=1 Tax=unclassified Methanobacterium TaxID=2627676 RepID=UPI0039C13F4E
MIKRSLVIVIACLIGISISAGSLDSGVSIKNSSLGADDRGNVIKTTYSYKKTSGPKIAVISGMHARENVSASVSKDAVRDYANSHKITIVNYNVKVNENLDYVFSVRKKGEELVAQYAVPDIQKSNYDLVIVCHDHKKGYGDGYYVATPTMDAKSLAMAEKFRGVLPELKYYQRNSDKEPKSKSILRVDIPIVQSGTPVFVYEIPEWSGYGESYDMTYKLIDAAYKVA